MKLQHSGRRGRATALLAISTVATLTLAACTGGSSSTSTSSGAALGAGAASGSKIKIAFVSGPLNDPFFPPLYQGTQDAAKQLPDLELNYIPIDEGDIQASSAKTMEAAIAQHPNVIVVGDFIPTVVDPLIEKAVAAGIPVFVNQSGQDSWEKVGAKGFIGAIGPDMGKESAKTFLAAGKKNMVCVVNVAGNPYLDAICKGLADQMSTGGGVSQVFTLPSGDGTDQSKTTKDIGGFLATHKDIDGIMTLNNLTGYSSIDALKSTGQNGKVAVGTLGVSKQAIDDVKSGDMLFMVNEQPYEDGYLGVINAYTYAKYGLAPIGIINTGPQIVDKNNVEKIAAVNAQYSNVIGPK